jgi:hypothetical protein
MGDPEAAKFLAGLQAAMEPEAWEEIVGDYDPPELVVNDGDHIIEANMDGRCSRCGSNVDAEGWGSHLAWHYETTIVIRSAMTFALKAPIVLAQLVNELQTDG